MELSISKKLKPSALFTYSLLLTLKMLGMEVQVSCKSDDLSMTLLNEKRDTIYKQKELTNMKSTMLILSTVVGIAVVSLFYSLSCMTLC